MTATEKSCGDADAIVEMKKLPMEEIFLMVVANPADVSILMQNVNSVSIMDYQPKKDAYIPVGNL